MINKHFFIFNPGTWLGKGTVSFNMSAEQLTFSTQWHIQELKNGEIVCVQEIDIDDVPDKMVNRFLFSGVETQKFSVNLNNEILGSIDGTGIIDEKLIAWEFRGSQLDFEGFEVFEKQKDGGYMTRAEYTSKDQMRTTIEGSIWHKE